MVPRAEGVLDGLGQQVVGLVPGAGPPLQGPQALGPDLLAQAPAQQVGKEPVVAVPAALGVEGDDEQVGRLELLQDALAAGRWTPGRGRQFGIRSLHVKERVAKRGAETVEEGGVEEKVLDLGRLVLQHLLDEIIEDVAVAAGKGIEKGVDLLGRRLRAGGDRLQGQGGHLQAGGPPLGARREGLDLVRRELQAHDPVQQLGGLAGQEAQVGLAQLGQLAATPQPRQRQGRVGPAGEDEVQGARQVLEQEGQDVVDRPLSDEVAIVQDQDQRRRAGQGLDLVDEGRQERLDGLREARARPGGLGQGRRLERGQQVLAQPRFHGLHGGDEVGQEAHGVVVGVVEGEPGDPARQARVLAR